MLHPRWVACSTAEPTVPREEATAVSRIVGTLVRLFVRWMPDAFAGVIVSLTFVSGPGADPLNPDLAVDDGQAAVQHTIANIPGPGARASRLLSLLLVLGDDDWPTGNWSVTLIPAANEPSAQVLAGLDLNREERARRFQPEFHTPGVLQP